MKRSCRKCGNKIPNRVIINGKEHNLHNRKFCLICSPFQKHNTSPNDPIVRKARKWKYYSKEQKDKVKLCLYRRALQIRKELHIKSGGKCCKCGYSKCDRALTFHHRDPRKKLFGLTLNNLWSKNRKAINNEWRKCNLMCMNCHMELEDTTARKTSIVGKINKLYATNY